LGVTQPGMTIVCGDSHTSTHGALGALAFGIGTSEVEHVLATQTLTQQRAKTMAVGGAGYVVEYRGQAIRDLSMEGRMTLCNMSIEAGARAGLVAVDDTTIDYLRGRAGVPPGDAFDEAAVRWRTFVSEEDAVFDKTVTLNAADLVP